MKRLLLITLLIGYIYPCVAQYKQAQKLANEIKDMAGTDRWNNNSYFDIAFNALGDNLAGGLGYLLILTEFPGGSHPVHYDSGLIDRYTGGHGGFRLLH